jgi:hypothetical protein
MHWKSRLTIIIFECCNRVVWHDVKGRNSLSIPPLSAIGIKKLFTEQQGIAIACSASPGEKAFGIPERPDFPTGGIFTTCFLSLLSQDSLLPQPSWKSFFERASLACQATSYRWTNTVQTPYIDVSTSTIETTS